MIATATDIRRYISNKAATGEKFQVKVSGGFQAADGRWTQVTENEIKANMKGEVPSWVPVYGGRKFDVTAAIEILDGKRARVTLSGSVSGSSEGTYTAQGDELKIVDLKFKGGLETVSEVSLTRWYQVETRASFYRIPYTRFWLESWWTPASADATASGDYPPPRVHEGGRV